MSVRHFVCRYFVCRHYVLHPCTKAVWTTRKNSTKFLLTAPSLSFFVRRTKFFFSLFFFCSRYGERLIYTQVGGKKWSRQLRKIFRLRTSEFLTHRFFSRIYTSTYIYTYYFFTKENYLNAYKKYINVHKTIISNQWSFNNPILGSAGTDKNLIGLTFCLIQMHHTHFCYK